MFCMHDIPSESLMLHPSSFNDDFTIVAGAQGSQKTFLLLTEHFKQHSKHIETKLASISEVEPPAARLIHLPEHTAEDFEVFALFVYTGNIYSIDADKASEWNCLARLWILGYELESTTFKDAIVDAILNKGASEGHYPDDLHDAVGAYLGQPTAIGKLLVDIRVAHYSKRIFTGPRNPQCWRFYYNCYNAIGDVRGGNGAWRVQERLQQEQTHATCQYHEHGTTQVCYKQMCPRWSKGARRNMALCQSNSNPTRFGG